MTITQAPADILSTALLAGRHLSSHSYNMALYMSEVSLGSGSTRYLTASETSGSGYTAGGQEITSYALARSGSTSYLNWADAVWPASTFSAAGCIIYNESLTSNEALGVYAFGSSVEVSAGTFTAVLPPASATSAVIRVGAGT